MPDSEFYPDKGRSIERIHAAELAREAKIERDRLANERRIREQMEDGTAGVSGTRRPQCIRCGDPYAALKNGLCPACIRDRKLTRDTEDKLSPEELYPDHFPQD
jgi:hypothetical protein